MINKSLDNSFYTQRMWGIVAKYNKERGYGFIRSKVDGRSYFVHVSQIQDRILDVGYLVEFGVGFNRRTEKEEAKNVIVVEDPAHKNMRKEYVGKGEKKPTEDNKAANRVPQCSECKFMKMYDYRYKNYYCDHEKRHDDMGKLGVGHPPETSPAWCPLRDK